MSKVTGRDCKLYYNTGSHASPTWVEITQAIDVSVDLAKNEAGPTRSRASDWEYTHPGLKNISMSFGYNYLSGADTVFDALKNSFDLDTESEFAVMDGAIASSGNEGPRFYGVVYGFNVQQGLEDPMTIDVEVKNAYKVESAALVEPDWYIVP